MVKKTPKGAAPAPTTFASGTPNLRIVDAETGKPIAAVIEADSDAGTLRRYAVDDDGHLVRESDAYQVVEEKRAIRIEWLHAPKVDAPDAAEDEG